MSDASHKRQREVVEEGPTKRVTRRGKWSAEEEAFAARLIRDFDAGLLPLENGATLRAFLSKKLNCSAMRISKKFAGEKCLGKQIFLRRSGVDEEQLRQEAELLARLETAFLTSIDDRRPPPVVSSSGSEDEEPLPKEKPKSSPPKPPAPPPVPVVEPEPPQEPDQVLRHLAQIPGHDKSFRELGHTAFVAREAQELADELVDAHRRANLHKSANFADLPKAECIQSPPAALMLELGPTPRARLPHPTIGAYAFSIARGTSNSSLQRMAAAEEEDQLVSSGEAAAAATTTTTTTTTTIIKPESSDDGDDDADEDDDDDLASADLAAAFFDDLDDQLSLMDLDDHHHHAVEDDPAISSSPVLSGLPLHSFATHINDWSPPEWEEVVREASRALALEELPSSLKGVEVPTAILVTGREGSGCSACLRRACFDLGAPVTRCRDLLVDVARRIVEDPTLEDLAASAKSPSQRAAVLFGRPRVLALDEIDCLSPTELDALKPAGTLILRHLDSLDPHDGGPKLVLVAANSLAGGASFSLATYRRYEIVVGIRNPSSEERRALMEGVAAAGYGRATLRAAAGAARLAEVAGCCAVDAATRVHGARRSALVEQWGGGPPISESEDADWGEVRGCRAAKREVEKAVLWPLARRDRFERLGLAAPSGVLLHGPPGCGKTLMGRAIARLLRASLVAVSSPRLRREHLGDSERVLRELFAAARDATPCVLFFDEIDSIGLARGATASDSGVQQRLVTTLLVELDGVDGREQNAGVTVVAATNRIGALDKALLRPGRLEAHVCLDLPDAEDREDVLRAYLPPAVLAEAPHLLRTLVDATSGFSNAQLAAVVREAAFSAIDLGGTLEAHLPSAPRQVLAATVVTSRR
ncbi:hypothetical protein CTAYLR_005515 [Chrysophaeum taylorii]|uniref:AAA+ ATPase domain-containing protein n=1 Tax=Chrysophaeum taylorii TaxID=2483200 RepID=A0AAD7XJA0_9STRA|nr:hypothetical protein CTAYLR_005515 [Chrysophaeum taylorii]